MLSARSLLPPPRDPPRDRIPFERFALAHGLAMHAAAGLYVHGPLLKRMLTRVEGLFSAAFEDRFQAEPVELGTLQDARFFERSGRLGLFGKEIFRVQDRRGRTFILSPTNEEVVAWMYEALWARTAPPRLSVYQIDRKFRDEVGGGSISRTREFRMMELYTFHRDEADVVAFGHEVEACLDGVLGRLGCDHEVKLSRETITSRFSGFRSHEFRVRSDVRTGVVDDAGRPLLELAKWTPLGDVYAGKERVLMSCLGVGAMRVLLHLFERGSAGDRLVWPREVLPFRVALAMPDAGFGDAAGRRALDDLARALPPADVLIDDRTSPRFAARLAQLLALGAPEVVTLAPRGAAAALLRYAPGRVTPEPVSFEHLTHGARAA